MFSIIGITALLSGDRGDDDDDDDEDDHMQHTGRMHKELWANVLRGVKSREYTFKHVKNT